MAKRRWPDTPEQRAFEAWVTALGECGQLAYVERQRTLDGDPLRTFAGDGTHPRSVAWGKVLAAELVLPELFELRLVPLPSTDNDLEAVNPQSIRSWATKDATDDWLRERGVEPQP